MKYLVFYVLLIVNYAYSTEVVNMHAIYSYKNVPESLYTQEAALQTALICACWAAKLDVYTFEVLDYSDLLIFSALGDDSSFFLRFYKEEKHCELEFNAANEKFNFVNFKKITDLYFLYNE